MHLVISGLPYPDAQSCNCLASLILVPRQGRMWEVVPGIQRIWVKIALSSHRNAIEHYQLRIMQTYADCRFDNSPSQFISLWAKERYLQSANISIQRCVFATFQLLELCSWLLTSTWICNLLQPQALFSSCIWNNPLLSSLASVKNAS